MRKREGEEKVRRGRGENVAETSKRRANIGCLSVTCATASTRLNGGRAVRNVRAYISARDGNISITLGGQIENLICFSEMQKFVL